MTTTTKPKPWNALRRRYGNTVAIVRALDVDDDIRVLVVGDPNNGSYDWAIEKHGGVESYSDKGYGIADIALRDGLIAYYGPPKSMQSERSASTTPEGHRQRHVELHKAFDELLADWMRHSPDRVHFLSATISELMQWSHRQTIEPDEVPK